MNLAIENKVSKWITLNLKRKILVIPRSSRNSLEEANGGSREGSRGTHSDSSVKGHGPMFCIW